MSGEWPSLAVSEMVVAMNLIGLILVRRRQLPSLRYPRLSAAASGKPRAARVALAPFMADRRGAVAFETMIVYLVLGTSLLLPLADLAAAGFRFLSAWGALRSFGEYIQYNRPTDITSTSGWPAQTTAGGYTISNIRVICGDAGAACSSSNITSPVKYYSYTTSLTLAPIISRAVLCPRSCTYTLTYSERYQ